MKIIFKTLNNVRPIHKKRYSQINKIIQTKWKNSPVKFSSKILNRVRDNVWEIWLFIREFPIPAMQIHHLKIVLYKSLAGLVELKFWLLENKNTIKNKKIKTRVFL